MSKEGSEQAKPELDAKTGQRKDFIGCVMSLISKQEIRYVGTLIMINSKEQTLVLQNVKSYGSEGRRGGGSDEVPGTGQIYEHIIFRAAELKDFYVIKGPEKDFKDPAILSTEEKPLTAAPITPLEPKEEKKYLSMSSEKILRSSAYPKPTTDLSENYHYQEEEMEPRRGRYQHPRYQQYRYPRGSPYKTEGVYHEKPGAYQDKAAKEKYSEEYDFEAMNKKFEALFKDSEAKVEIGVKYDKAKSFYDGISRGTDDKGENSYDRLKQRQIDADTFDLDTQFYPQQRGGYYPRYRRGGYGYGRRGYRGYGGNMSTRGQQPSMGRRGGQTQFYYRRKA